MEIGINNLTGLSNIIEGQFTYIETRPISFQPSENNFSTDVNDYLQNFGGIFDDQYDLRYNGNQI